MLNWKLMCGVGKKQIHGMSLNNEPSAALQRTATHWRRAGIEVQKFQPCTSA